MDDCPPIVLYHYLYSPFARRIQWYLLLRGLPYSECIQPPTMPRPDLVRLGVRHRRIPVLALGRDVFVDTRLMLRQLEQLCPAVPRLAVSGAARRPETAALERLLDVWTVDSGLFAAAGTLIPHNLPLMRDPAFQKDRADFFGRPTASPGPKASAALRRAEALVHVRHAAELLESTLLADGRSWVLDTPTPSLADIEAVWPFHWLTSMPGALTDAVSPAQFPLLFAWIDRFHKAVRAARAAQTAPPPALDGAQAAAAVLAAPYLETNTAAETSLIEADPVAQAVGLHAGQRVMLRPTDTGTSGRDVGKLLRLTADEVVLELEADGVPSVRLHAPRHGFVVRPTESNQGKDTARL